MNFQNLKPVLPASRDGSASHDSRWNDSRWNRFAVILLPLAMALFPSVSAHSQSSLPSLSMTVHSHGFIDGAYFLVSKPFSHVRTALERSLATQSALRGFKARNDSARLTDMEFHWAYVAVSHRPEVLAALNQPIKATFTAALTAGVITAEEQTRFEQAIAQRWTHNKAALENTSFFPRRIARWSYTRHRGTSHRYHDDYITIMDISPLLGRSPVTLVWFSSTWTKITPHGKSMSKSSGYTSRPSSQKDGEDDARMNSFTRFMARMAKRMPVLSKQDTQDAMRTDLVGTSEHKEADPDSIDTTAMPAIDVQGSDLPADEAHIRPDSDRLPAWQMLALPDGSVLASGLASHRFVQRETEVKRLDAEPGLYALDGLKIDPAGTVWGHGATSHGASFFQSWSPASGSGSTFQVCNSEERPALPFKSPDQVHQICASRYSGNWIVQAGQGIALRSGADIFALDKDGKWTHRTWDEKLRSAVWDALASHCRDDPIIQFGGGLLWQADYDGYGVDPRTARVAQTVVPSKAFFGSLSAGWGLGFSTTKFDQFRIVDLSTGKPRLDVKTGGPRDFNVIRYSIARSAHGRLLAISDSSSNGPVIVLDMKQGKPLAALRMPQGDTIDAMAFSWHGDKLWLYARKADASGGRKMIVWDIPASVADAAQEMDVPDQLRFNFVPSRFFGRCF